MDVDGFPGTPQPSPRFPINPPVPPSTPTSSYGRSTPEPVTPEADLGHRHHHHHGNWPEERAALAEQTKSLVDTFVNLPAKERDNFVATILNEGLANMSEDDREKAVELARRYKKQCVPIFDHVNEPFKIESYEDGTEAAVTRSKNKKRKALSKTPETLSARKKEEKTSKGNEILDWIDYKKHNLPFVQKNEITPGIWEHIKVDSIKWKDYQAFLQILFQMDKNKWLVWFLHKINIYITDRPNNKMQNYTSVWVGQGSPYVDRYPVTAAWNGTTDQERKLVQLGPDATDDIDKNDRLGDWLAAKRKDSAQYQANSFGMNPDRPKDVAWGCCSEECFVQNYFKNICDPRTAYFGTWQKGTGGSLAPMVDFPTDRASLKEKISLPGFQNLATTKTGWLDITMSPRFYSIKGQPKDAYPLLDDPFTMDLWIATSVGQNQIAKGTDNVDNKKRVQKANLTISSLWHLAEVNFKEFTPILELMLMIYLKRWKWPIPSPVPNMHLKTMPQLSRLPPVAAQALYQIVQRSEDGYTFDPIVFFLAFSKEQIAGIGHAEDVLPPNHPYMQLVTPGKIRFLLYYLSEK